MRHVHKGKEVKRLHHTYPHGEHPKIKNWPGNIIDENLFNQPSKYTKYFDYPLAQSLADHSTNPLQNTTRQYADKVLNIPSEGRFVNHEMIIRRNGETTILRPRQDLVLANGFTPVIRPSSILPSYHPIISHSSLSIMNKMSVKKCEPTSIIKSKRKNRRQRKRSYPQTNNPSFEYSNSNVIHLLEQALDQFIAQQPPPLMSIQPQFHNQPLPPRFEDPYLNRPPYFHEQPPLHSIPKNQSFYDCPPRPYQNFQPHPPPSENYQPHPPPSEHFYQRNYNHMSDYFFHGF